MFSFFSKVSANYSKLAYDFNFNGIDGNKIELSEYRKLAIILKDKCLGYEQSHADNVGHDGEQQFCR